jgi:6-carboxyhexanoate--CoA ligase
MWSVRMRASRDSSQPLLDAACAQRKDLTHISGAEGIYDEHDLDRAVADYALRALRHPRGKPDTIILTVEKLRGKIRSIPVLPVSTIKCSSPEEAAATIRTQLLPLGISARAISAAMTLIRSGRTMRGASLMIRTTGKRIEPDRRRGVRVSRLGFERSSFLRLCRQLSRSGINSQTVREALLIASKVASSREVIAEICISDDPDYTTGYLASSIAGYLRLPSIKLRGESHGGRVFFVKENLNLDRLIRYLEQEPVLARL